MNCSLNAAEKVSGDSKSSKAFGGKSSKGSGKAEKVATVETVASAKSEKMSVPTTPAMSVSAKASKPPHDDGATDAGWGGSRARV